MIFKTSHRRYFLTAAEKAESNSPSSGGGVDLGTKSNKLDETLYIHDPEHKNRPEGGGWKETNRGWSKAEKKPAPKKDKDNKTPSTPTDPSLGDGTPLNKKDKAREEKKDTAIKSVADYYGGIEIEEKKQAEADAAKLISDYIQKISKGEEAELPELSHDSKVKFIQAMFIALKAKQIEGIKPSNKLVAKQKDMVVKNLYDLADKSLDQVVLEISHKSITGKHISPVKEVESFYKKSTEPKTTTQPEMSFEEFSDDLALNPSISPKEYTKEFLKKPRNRGLDFKDLPIETQQRADYLAFQNSEYAKNWASLNWGIKGNVKIKSRKDSSDFVFGEYKPNQDSVISDITLPIDDISNFGEISKSMDAVIKKMVVLGFSGIIQTDKNPESIGLNKGTLRVISDDPKQALAVNNIIKETFAENKLNVKTSVRKQMFGMSEAQLFQKRTELKKAAIRSGDTDKNFRLPVKDIEQFMAAARYSGMDLQITKGKPGFFHLVPHNPNSNVGGMKIDIGANTHPKQVITDLFFNQKKDAAKPSTTPEKDLPDIPITDPYQKLRKQFSEEKLEPEPDFSALEEEGGGGSEPSIEPEPSSDFVFNPDEIEKQSKEIINKAQNKDLTVFKDIDNVVTGILKDIDEAKNERLYKNYEKNMKQVLIALLNGGINTQTPPEISEKIKSVFDKLKEAQTQNEPKTAKDFDFEKQSNFKKPDLTSDEIKTSSILDKKGFPTGWSQKGTLLATSDGQYGLEFNSPQQAKAWARQNPYRDINKPLYADVLDNDHDEIISNDDYRNGNKLAITKEHDLSKVQSIIDKYGMNEKSDNFKDLLGYKRYLLSQADDGERKNIRENGFLNHLGKREAAKVQQEFLSKLSVERYGDKLNWVKSYFSEIEPNDFVKILAGITSKS